MFPRDFSDMCHIWPSQLLLTIPLHWQPYKLTYCYLKVWLLFDFHIIHSTKRKYYVVLHSRRSVGSLDKTYVCSGAKLGLLYSGCTINYKRKEYIRRDWTWVVRGCRTYVLPSDLPNLYYFFSLNLKDRYYYGCTCTHRV